MERREFIRDAAATAGWTALSASRVLGANDRVLLGLIGSGGRGRWVSTGLLKAPGTEIVAVCDVYDANAEQASKELAGGKAKTSRDFRQLLESKEIDAVYVATPDHWHTQKEDFVNDREASRLLTRTLRKPYDLVRI